MSDLPSIYSSHGLSETDRKKVITTGKPREQRSIGAIKIETRVNNVIDHEPNQENFDNDGDIPMLGMDDENEVQFVTEYVLDKRNTEATDSILPTDLISQSERDLTPEEKPNKETMMVIDTNFIISHLDILDELAKLHKKYHHQIIIPSTVVRELDGLKSSNKKADDSNGSTIGHLARWANDWIYKKFAELDSSVRGQKVREFLDRDAVKDDSILDCCLYFQQKNNALVILLSNDKNLCMKALSNDILTVSYRKGMSADLIAKISFVENKNAESSEPQAPTEELSLNDNHDHDMIIEEDYYHANDDRIQYDQNVEDNIPIRPEQQVNQNNHLITVEDFHEAASLIYKEVQTLVLAAIDHCMYEEYEDDLELIGYEKSEVLTLRESALTIIKYWMSVFTEYFRSSQFKPFIGRGKKVPQYTTVPQSKTELVKFVDYWSNVLRGLYLKRDDSQNSALEKVIERWEHISNSHQ